MIDVKKKIIPEHTLRLPFVTILMMIPLPWQPTTHTYSTKYDSIIQVNKTKKTITFTITVRANNHPTPISSVPQPSPPPPLCTHTNRHHHHAHLSRTPNLCCTNQHQLLCVITSHCRSWHYQICAQLPSQNTKSLRPLLCSKTPSTTPSTNTQNPTHLVASCGAPSFATSHNNCWHSWVADLGQRWMPMANLGQKWMMVVHSWIQERGTS